MPKLMTSLAHRFVLACGLAAMLPAMAAAPAHRLTVLCYHEVADRQDALDASYAVRPAEFAKQVDWLKDNGYSFVDLDAVLADRAGRKPLPPKAVLLTFDDGYRSVYRNVFPLLKREHIPAVVAVVGSWLEVPEHANVDLDGRAIPRTALMSWQELREMQSSGLVDIASHTYALHGGLLANPQGNKEPAATARAWLPDAKRYESESAYRRRIHDDLARNNALIQKMLHVKPRAVVWPYGRYNVAIAQDAVRLGMPMGFNLDDGANTRDVPDWALRRELVMGNESVQGLAFALRQRANDILDEGRPTKAAHIDLDYIYDPDPQQQETNLGKLLDRLQVLGVNTVYLQAFSDPDANGAADAVYFPNRHLPMRADLFNRAAWQILTRTQVKRVYAWMPLLAWQLPASDPAAKDSVVTLPNKANHLAMGYPRLSPFSPRARKAIREIYEDLGRAATFDGILFHDDVTLSDYEDGSPWALAQYKAWGLPQPLPELRANPKLLRRWTDHKVEWLDAFAGSVAASVRQELPGLQTTRNLYAQVALNPESETWYAQSLQASLRHYDYTAIMVMPYMEQAPDATAFYRQMVDRVAAIPGAMEKVVFELQSVDWRRNDAPLPPDELPDTVARLYSWGVKHVGYYPDNVFTDTPDARLMRQVFITKPDSPPGNRLE